MVRYDDLVADPTAFRAMTGLDGSEFDALLADALPRLAAADRARHTRPDRRRAIGAGHPFALTPPDQVLLTVVWLRHYPTNVLLGRLFGVDERTVRRTTARVLPVLAELGRAELRPPDRAGCRVDLNPVLAGVPAVAVVVDTFEQPIQRPTDRAAADAHYSGKKKRHTVKRQVVVQAGDGRLTDVSGSVRGPTADLTLAKETGVVARLPADIGGWGDLAYVGLAGVHPDGRGATPRRKPRGRERPAEDLEYNRAFARRRVVVEHTIRRLRVYQSLTQLDRHHRRYLDAWGWAVAGLVNRQLAARVAASEPAEIVTLPARPAAVAVAA